MDYHKRRYNEKSDEVNKRIKRFQNKPISLSDNRNIETFSQPINRREFNHKWAYQPVELYGKFEHSKEILVKAFRDGEEGFQIFTPFYFLNEDLQENAIFVDRGWVDDFESKSHRHTNNQVGVIPLRGVLTQVATNSKHSKENNIRDNEWHSVNLEEMTKYSRLPNQQLAKSVYLKQIDQSQDASSVFPLTETIKSINEFHTSPEKHLSLSRFFGLLTFTNVFANLVFWVCL